jgi:hypothetical protein
MYLPLIFQHWPPERLLISEVVYNPAAKEPDGEWVEFYNAGYREIDLSSYKFGDEETLGEAEGMLQFPPGAKIGPGEVIVVASSGQIFQGLYGEFPDYEMRESDPFVPNMIKYTAWAGGIVELNNTGDEVLVLNGRDEIVDTLAYGNSNHYFEPAAPKVADGHSLERRPVYQDTDSAQDWADQASPNPWSVDMSTPTLTSTSTSTQTATPPLTVSPSGTVTASPTATTSQTPGASGTLTATLTPTPRTTPTITGTPTSTATSSATPTVTFTSTRTPQATPLEARLLISEVLYDPSGTEPDEEWVELYNGGGSVLDLTGYKVGDEETYGGTEGMYRFPDGAHLVSGGVIIIANRASAFEASFGFMPDYELVESIPGVPNLLKYSDWSGGSVYLNNNGDEVLVLDPADVLVDAVSWGDSTWAFDPSAPDVDQGHSLERRPVYQDTDSATDWVDQPSPLPAVVDPPSITPTPSPTGSPTQTGTPTRTGTCRRVDRAVQRGWQRHRSGGLQNR